MLRPSLLPKLVPGTLVAALLLLAALFTTADAPRVEAASVATIQGGVPFVGDFNSLELDGAGNPVISYVDEDNYQLKVAHCGNATCTAGNTIASPDTISGFGNFAYTSLALDGSGRPVVSYYNGEYGTPFRDLKVLHCGNVNCTAGNTINSPDTVGDVGQDTSLVLDGAGNPVVSYYDETNGDLKVLHCNDANCAAGGDSITSPDTAGNVGWYTDIVLDGSGYPVVSYHDGSNGDLKVLHCNDANCAAGGDSFASPDTLGDVGVDTSLALDGAGRPVVAYQDATNGDLKVLHCGNANCTAGNSITSPDTSGYVGEEASLALDGLGRPVVSYIGESDEVLKILDCGDPNCSAGNTITEHDGSGDFLRRTTSLELDGSGYPVVSYHAYLNGKLKLLRCTDFYCGAKVVAQNDAFANATVVAGPPYGEATNTLATTSAGNDPAASCVGAGYSNSVWFDYTPPLTGNVQIATAGSGYDTVLAVYTGTKGALTEVACDDDSNATVQSQVDIQVNAGTTYHILVGDYGAPGGGVLRFALAHPSYDTDGDGCGDSIEQSTGPGSELTGGNRDYQNPYDYFNPTHDHVNRIDDVLQVVDAYFKDDNDGNPGQLPYDVDYSADYDRTLIGPNAWDLGPPNGLQRIDDVVNIVKQYYHDCG